MDKPMRFVIALEDGESITSLLPEVRNFAETGFKILDRYEECGMEVLSDRAGSPSRSGLFSFRADHTRFGFVV